MAEYPLAYLLTFTCYGTHLPGDERGYVDRRQSKPGTRPSPPSQSLHLAAERRMLHPSYQMDPVRRGLALAAMLEVCEVRRWTLIAAHVRPSHVHAVCHALAAPEKVIVDWKAYISRRPNQKGIDPDGCERWTRHGSTRYLWKQEWIEAAVHYVLHQQGAPLETYVAWSGFSRES